MAIGEAVTNIAAADIEKLGDVKLSANWMAAAGHRGEDAKLYDTVKAVSDFCVTAGLSIPVGKDSLSMRTAWQDDAEDKQVVAPLSLIATAFAPVQDIRSTLTPQLQLPEGVETELLLIDLGNGKNRLGGSVFAQAYNSVGEHAPDVDPAQLKAFFDSVQRLRRDGLLLAYHDRSDGGLFATVCEMAFAAKCGLSLVLDTVCYDPYMNDVDGLEKKPDTLKGRFGDRLFAGLFAEELGAVIQIRRDDRARVTELLRSAQLSYHFIGEPNDKDEIRLRRNAKLVFGASRVELLQAWSETSYRIAKLRDDPESVQQEFDGLADATDPGRSVSLSFDVKEDVAAPFIASGVRPKVVVLREQGRTRSSRWQRLSSARASRPSMFTCPTCRPAVSISPISMAWRLAVVSRTVMCWGRGRAGRSPSCSTAACVTNSRHFSAAVTPLRLASATAAR